jgi:hypothetical protein
VNGLASGFEHVVALYFVITMTTSDVERPQLRHGATEEVLNAVDQLPPTVNDGRPATCTSICSRMASVNDRALSDLDLGVHAAPDRWRLGARRVQWESRPMRSTGFRLWRETAGSCRQEQ